MNILANFWSRPLRFEDRPRQRGFSLLELIIALALLGTLLSVAWSLLGTYRTAEQRSWDVAYRIQQARIARNWLENDISHLQTAEAIRSHPAHQGVNSTNLVAFEGQTIECNFWILPPVDPLPWLDDVLSTLSADRSSPLGDFPEHAQRRVDPQSLCLVRYRLVRQNQASPARFYLQRTVELFDPWVHGDPQSIDTPVDNERLLSTADLYRRVDESDNTSQQETIVIEQTKLSGLADAKFRFRGNDEWRSEWNSRFGDQLPSAIELTFDFPPRSESSTQEQSSGANRLGASSDGILQTAEAVATVRRGNDLDESDPCDVRILVAMPGQSAPSASL